MYFSWRWPIQERIPQTVQQFQFDERFEDLIEISTASGNRRLEPKWTELLNEFLHPLNCHCVWVFKKSPPYFRHEAACKVEGCNCKVKITINEISDPFGKSVFMGNVNHKTSTLASRQINGEKGNLEKQAYKSNII